MNDIKTLLEKLENDATFRASFKEDSVREQLLKPLLDKFGFIDKDLNKKLPPRSAKKSKFK